uniref:uncharacterized protein LOC120344719 n=1 Tax=Styela clava TaxID=7725 RepID=UPI00193969A1|nr:uncharacterized protein LOC120344719 [Styela clava]
MRAANKAIKRVKHPMPTMDELIHDLNGCKVFSKLDLNQGYHQIELHPDSRYITTFSTHLGIHRHKRLNFGVNAATEKFQFIIEQVLQGLEGVKNISDDIYIFSKNDDGHEKHIRACLQRIKEKGLTLNKRKYGSPFGIGAILTQRSSKSGKVQVVAYASRSLDDVETRYSQIEREALAVRWGVEHFHLPGANNPADYLSRHPSKAENNRDLKIAEEFLNYVCESACPKAITLKEIEEETFNDPMMQNKITPLWPRGNAQAENFMKPLNKAIKTATVEGKSWKQELYKFLRNYRATPHVTTHKAPAELLYGRNIKVLFPEVIKVADDKELRECDSKQKPYRKGMLIRDFAHDLLLNCILVTWCWFDKEDITS